MVLLKYRDGSDRAASGALELHGQDDETESIDSHAGQLAQGHILNDMNTGFGQTVLMHGHHDLGMISAGQNFQRHVVSANGNHALFGQPFRGTFINARLAFQIDFIVGKALDYIGVEYPPYTRESYSDWKYMSSEFMSS